MAYLCRDFARRHVEAAVDVDNGGIAKRSSGFVIGKVGVANLQLGNERLHLCYGRGRKSTGAVRYGHAGQALYIAPRFIARAADNLADAVAIPLPQRLREGAVLARALVEAHRHHSARGRF